MWGRSRCVCVKFRAHYAGVARWFAETREVPLDLDVTPRISWSWLVRHRAIPVLGAINLPGTADHRPISGRVTWASTSSALTHVFYQLDFAANDGSPCTLVGSSECVPGELIESMTVVHARMTRRLASGALASEGGAVVRFDLRSDTMRVLRSVTLQFLEKEDPCTG